MLQDDHTMIALIEAMLDISAAIGEFTDIPPLKVGAGGEDDIGKLGFTFKPDGLIHHKFQIVGPVAYSHNGLSRPWCQYESPHICNTS